ncbi:MAG: DUF3667 domain-containing protein [Ferruginibacter sp.]
MSRLNLKHLLHDVLHYITHADKGFLLLIKQLLTRSGTVAKEYIEGKRKRHFPPLNFFFLVATILVLVFSLVPLEKKDILQQHPELNYIKDPLQKAKVIRIYERQAIAMGFLNKYSNVIAMIAVPLICLIYWLCYFRASYNYIEHLVACMYMVGITNLIYACLIVPFSLLIDLNSSGVKIMLFVLFLLFQIIYNGVFYVRFIGKLSRSSTFKAVGVSILAVSMWYVVSALTIGAYIKHGFWGIFS